jgi:hypothetical protein
MSTKGSDNSKRPRRRKAIEPIHVEELLAGAGMSGFLGVLDRPAPATHLEKLANEGGISPSNSRRIEAAMPLDRDRVVWDARSRPARTKSSDMPARVASVIRKVQALTDLIKAKSEDD